jgi:hypothetical protein
MQPAYAINIAVLADTSSSELSLILQAPSSDVAAQQRQPLSINLKKKKQVPYI